MTDSEIESLISELQMIAADTVVTRVLERLKNFDPIVLDRAAKHPQPMFFSDAWAESFEVLLHELKKKS